MEHEAIARLAYDLLVVLAAGLLSGSVCKRLGLSVLPGYILVGAAIGAGGLGIVGNGHGHGSHDLEYLAEIGVLLLLFSVGIEFSLAELLRMLKFILLGGTIQMSLVAGIVIAVSWLCGVTPQAAVLLGAAVAFSSTVLVFKTLDEWGQMASPHGRRAVGILLFQDAAVVPLVLLIPFLATGEDAPGGLDFVWLAVKSVGFLAGIPICRYVMIRHLAPWLVDLRSVELLTLFTLSVVGGAAMGAHILGLPPVIGAFGAGLVLNGNRLTRQIDAVVLPFRETFAAVFFVSLGTLLRLDILWTAPLVCFGVLIGITLLKTGAAALALRTTGISWRSAAGTGLGLSQVGEFAFVVLMAGISQGVLRPADYDIILFVSVLTLVAAPELIKIGIRAAETDASVEHEMAIIPSRADDVIPRAMVVGIGPVGTRVASQLETIGYDACLVDVSPINLQAFAQQGFRTITGDGSDPAVLERADIAHSDVIVVAVPDDNAAERVVQAARRQNATGIISSRCRFNASRERLRSAGADHVFSEEAEVAAKVATWLETLAVQRLG